MSGLPTRKTVDDLIALGGAEPPIMNSRPSQPIIQEIQKLYADIYVPGLSCFFETQWYDMKNDRGIPGRHSIEVLLNNQPLMGLFGTFVQIISVHREDEDYKYACQLEECIVWGLAKLVFATKGRGWALPGIASSTNPIPSLDDPHEALGRLQVFEALLLGPNSTLTENPLCNPNILRDLQTSRGSEFEFWWSLANLVIGGPNSDLQNLRCLIGDHENRNFLYSLAVLREYSYHWDPSNIEKQMPSQLSEADPRCRLAVAARHIRTIMHEGSTNVIRRFGQLAWRAYIYPGANTTDAPWRKRRTMD